MQDNIHFSAIWNPSLLHQLEIMLSVTLNLNQSINQYWVYSDQKPFLFSITSDVVYYVFHWYSASTYDNEIDRLRYGVSWLYACQLSATGPFQSLQPVFGTVCRSTSRLHRLFPPSEAVWRLTSSAAAIQLSSPRSDFFTPAVPVTVTVTVTP